MEAFQSTQRSAGSAKCSGVARPTVYLAEHFYMRWAKRQQHLGAWKQGVRIELLMTGPGTNLINTWLHRLKSSQAQKKLKLDLFVQETNSQCWKYTM